MGEFSRVEELLIRVLLGSLWSFVKVSRDSLNLCISPVH
jgi:hypothetical protein